MDMKSRSELCVDLSCELIDEVVELANKQGIDFDDYILRVLEEEVLKNITISMISH